MQSVQRWVWTAILNTLVNEDKHRVPLITTGVFENTSFFGFADGKFSLVGTGQIIVPSLNAENPFASGYVNVHPQATVFATWQDVTMPREPVDRTLEKFVKSVSDVIPKFEQLSSEPKVKASRP